MISGALRAHFLVHIAKKSMDTSAGKSGDTHEAEGAASLPWNPDGRSPDAEASSVEDQRKLEPDKQSEKLPARKSANGVEPISSVASSPEKQLGSDRKPNQGFGFASENLKPEALPSFVKQHQNTLTFPEKVQSDLEAQLA